MRQSLPPNNFPYQPPGCIICRLLAAFLFICALVSANPGNAANFERRPLIYGIASVPFPIIAHLGYPLARAEAWLAALEDARNKMPASMLARLRKTGYGSPLAARALCALAFPLDVVTPERTDPQKVRVFLKPAKDPEKLMSALLSRPWLLAREMAIVQDTANNAQDLRLNWPNSLAAAAKEMARLDGKTGNLNSLWQATALVDKELADERPQWLPAIRAIPESAPILLEIARETGDMELADKTVELAMREQSLAVQREERNIWNQIIGDALFIRGKSHEKLGQYALAETDYSAALARLSKNGVNDKLMLDLALARGALRKMQKKYAGMCEDYSTACALGYCQELAIARRTGECGPGA